MFQRCLNQTYRFSSYRFCLLFIRSRVQISARRLTIITDIIRGFLQFLHVNSTPVPQIR